MKSYNILVEKLKTSLIGIIQAIKKDQKDFITFEELGRLLYQLDIFKVLEFDENNKRTFIFPRLFDLRSSVVNHENAEEFENKEFKRRVEEVFN